MPFSISIVMLLPPPTQGRRMGVYGAGRVSACVAGSPYGVTTTQMKIWALPGGVGPVGCGSPTTTIKKIANQWWGPYERR